MSKTKIRIIGIILAIAAIIIGIMVAEITDCNEHEKNLTEGDLLVVAVKFNSPDYFLRNGNVEGFSFNILTDFAEQHNFQLKFVDVNNHQNADIICKIGDSVYLEKSENLTNLVDEYFETNKNHINILYQKYFVSYKNLFDENYTIKNNRISSFDPIIQKYAQRINWDWRLLASLIYQESNFILHQESSGQAYGLMQLIPSNLEKYGIDKEASIEEQVAAGVKHIRDIQKILKDSLGEDSYLENRRLFVIASYNAGVNYVLRVRERAKARGFSPNIWFGNVETVIVNPSATLSSEEIEEAQQNVSRRARQVSDYVQEIILRYYNYVNLMPNEPTNLQEKNPILSGKQA